MSGKFVRERRPVFLAPLKIRLPVGALTSIAHRVSGILLSVSVAFGVFLLHLSLSGEAGFQQAHVILGSWPVLVTSPIALWALAHHLMAGVRHLLTDVGIGSSLPVARRTAWTINLLAPLFAAVAFGALW